MCEGDVCLPACFVRQTYMVLALLTSHHADKIDQEDNRTPPGFAVVMHHRPYQLIATLACQSVRAKRYRLQLLAHVCQQPASDVKVHPRQPTCTSAKPAQSNAAHVLTVNIKIRDYGKEEMDAYMFQ